MTGLRERAYRRYRAISLDDWAVARGFLRHPPVNLHAVAESVSALAVTTVQLRLGPTSLRLTASRLMLKNKGFMFAFSGFRLKSVPPIYPALLPFFIPPR